MAVFVLDRHKKPLMPCSEKRARLLLERGRARIHKMSPFTIRLVDRLVENSATAAASGQDRPGLEDHRHGARSRKRYAGTPDGPCPDRGRAPRRPDTGCPDATADPCVVTVVNSQLRYREKRFDNRSKPEGWLAPSLQHRVDTVGSWVSRLQKLAPVTARSTWSLVRFDAHLMQDPSIEGEGYQQGSLFEYEVREYCLEKWSRTCMYCDATGHAA